MHKFEHWVIACLVLAALAAFFFFFFRGYTYISVTLLFIAALIVVFHLGSEPVKRIVAILTCIGLIYFCASFVEEFYVPSFLYALLTALLINAVCAVAAGRR